MPHCTFSKACRTSGNSKIWMDIMILAIGPPYHDFCCKNCSECVNDYSRVMNYEHIALFLNKTHEGGDNEL